MADLDGAFPYFEQAAGFLLTINVNAENDAPTLTLPSAVPTVDEDSADNPISGISVSDGDGDVLTITLTAASTLSIDPSLAATLAFTIGDGTADETMTFSGSVADINAALATLTYTPTTDNDVGGSIEVTVNDGTATPVTDTITVDITPINDPPSGADATVTIDEDTTYTFSATDFGFTDPDTGDSLAAVRIDTLPTAGTLTLDGNPVAATDVVTATGLGLLVFTPDANANGAGYASFTFSVEDDNGAFATSPNTLTVDVTPVNDPPSGADATVTIDEDTSYTFSATDFGFTDPDTGDSLAAVRIDTLPTAGTLTLDGNPVAATDVVTATGLGLLVFTPDANANGAGYASFTFSVEDDNGAFATSPSTLTVDVTPINDPPVDHLEWRRPERCGRRR